MESKILLDALEAHLRNQAAVMRSPPEADRWRETLCGLLQWAATACDDHGCGDEAYVLRAVRFGVRHRVTHRVFDLMSGADPEMRTHALTLRGFYRGQVPPGPDVLAAVLWFYPDDAAAHLAAMPYAQYLQTPYWKCVRAMAMERDGGRCRMCNSAGPIQVHHRTYEHRGSEHEHLDDLTTLCADCHQRHHKGGPHP